MYHAGCSIVVGRKFIHIVYNKLGEEMQQIWEKSGKVAILSLLLCRYSLR